MLLGSGGVHLRYKNTYFTGVSCRCDCAHEKITLASRTYTPCRTFVTQLGISENYSAKNLIILAHF